MLFPELKMLHLRSTASPSATLLIDNFLKFDQALHECIQDERKRNAHLHLIRHAPPSLCFSMARLYPRLPTKMVWYILACGHALES